ncbi:MAG: class I mannose-6-phosphate isomerase [Duncaniella sp.]|nr:class I mannose-6-phosphate isomerase [Duncaniella sp.]
MELKEPLHFSPYLKSVIWGGEAIAPFKGIVTDQKSIGESWEISAVPGKVSVVDRGSFKGRSLTELIEEFGPALVGGKVYETYGKNFPLLIKIIDAKDNLSVQVHPDDELAEKRHHCPGKTEMWHIIDTAPGAKIYVGLKQQITPDEYERRVADNTIMDVIDSYDSTPGDTFFLPAGRIHAIGAGNLLAEIQETSDITYRIYDYDRRDADGNPRQLHTEQARDAIDYTVYPDYKNAPVSADVADVDLVNCHHFDVRRILLDNTCELPMNHTRDSFMIVMCLAGEATLKYGTEGRTETIRQGDTLLFPASLGNIAATGTATLLQVES